MSAKGRCLCVTFPCFDLNPLFFYLTFGAGAFRQGRRLLTSRLGARTNPAFPLDSHFTPRTTLDGSFPCAQANNNVLFGLCISVCRALLSSCRCPACNIRGLLFSRLRVCRSCWRNRFVRTHGRNMDVVLVVFQPLHIFSSPFSES